MTRRQKLVTDLWSMTNRRGGNLSFCGQYLSLAFPAELRLCVKDSSNCLSVRPKCQLIINTLRAAGHVGYVTLSKEEQSSSIIHPADWSFWGQCPRGFTRDRGQRHFPHSELNISLKSLFRRQTPPEDVLSHVLSQFLRQVDDMGNV